MIVFDKRLKKCPLCGGDCYYEEIEFGSTMVTVYIRCRECVLSGQQTFLISAKNRIERTIDYWNTRIKES